MDISIKINNEYLDLPEDFNFSVTRNNPLFSTEGSQTVPLDIPNNPHNRRILGFLDRIDKRFRPVNSFSAKVAKGSSIYQSKIEVNSTTSKNISITIYYEESFFYNQIKDKKMSDLPWPVLEAPSYYTNNKDRIRYWVNYLEQALDPAFSEDRDLLTCNFLVKMNDGNLLLNEIDQYGRNFRTREDEKHSIKIDGVVHIIDIPGGSYITPFIKLKTVIKGIVELSGYKISYDYLADKYPVDYNEMFLINSTADTLLNGRIKYSDLLPDCTISDFIRSLFMKFGICFFVNENNKTIRIDHYNNFAYRLPQGYKKINCDIIDSQKIFSQPERMKMKFTTEKQALSDFYKIESKGFSTIPSRINLDLSTLTPRNYYYILAEGNFVQATTIDDKISLTPLASGFIDFEAPRLIETGVDPIVVDHQGTDRNVTVDFLRTPEEFYLAIKSEISAKFLNSYIFAGGEMISEEETETPIMIAYIRSGIFQDQSVYYRYYYASINVYDNYGNLLPGRKLSLTPMMQHGIYGELWSKYDEFKALANDTIEVSGKMSNIEAQKLSFHDPYSFRGQKVIIEKIVYNTADENVNLSLRTIRNYTIY